MQVLLGDLRLPFGIPQNGGQRLLQTLLGEPAQGDLTQPAEGGLRAPPSSERLAGRLRAGERHQEELLAAGGAQQARRDIQGERIGPLQIVELQDERRLAAQGDEAGGETGGRLGGQGGGFVAGDRERLGRGEAAAGIEQLAGEGDAEARLHHPLELAGAVRSESGPQEVEEHGRRSGAAPAIVEEPGVEADRPLPAGPGFEVARELGLADPGLADDEEGRGLAGEGPAVLGPESLHFEVAPGELVEVEIPLMGLDQPRNRRSGDGGALDRSDEAVAAAVPGLDEPALLRRIVQGPADLRHGFLEDPVCHIGVRPDLVQKLVLADHAAGVADEVAEDAHGPGLQGDDRVAAEEQIDPGEDPERAEDEGLGNGGWRGERGIQRGDRGQSLHHGRCFLSLSDA